MNSNFGKIIINRNEVDYQDFNLIFMIGIGYENELNQWVYQSFIVRESTKNSEKEMLNNFWDFINGILKKYNKQEAVFIHWSMAEKISYEKSKLRHPEMPDKNFVDLYQVFLNEPIVVRGALNYSLKSIAKALYNHKIINTIWDVNSVCANGLNAMLIANNIYSKLTDVTNKNPLMKDIEHYNEIDCKCLWEIIKYLRKNH
jgi:predicted RecB family nuclease